MSPTIVGPLLFLAIVGAIAAAWHIARPAPEPPPGVEIAHFEKEGWCYFFNEGEYVAGTGYWTRRHAILGAQDEYRRRLGQADE